MNVYGHEPGQPLECLSIAVELKKKAFIDTNGQTAYKVGFKIGGGIDQDRTKAPFQYPDSVKIKKIIAININKCNIIKVLREYM